ncbi:Tetrapyrrole (Corrin/Porphyrin) Methylase [Phytophthora infestans]|uniref:uroporphyrinogen-III C-methyltransferase n=1 Tax=Phytophthora infestans TaxID=4787 RepID=A0A833T871_PHYIN|nr:Tetrapyrrole (Corrin/Porphyrin) Methylase [Phytophthora infestans]
MLKKPKQLKRIIFSAMTTTKGKMLLVGAGPGDPELLTLKAYRALQQADLVLADRLVPTEVLKIATCEVRVARKRCGKADLAQAELDAWGLEALAQCKRVVRLKNGDPFMYGRGGEEAVIYSEAGFDVEVIPGISSSLSAPGSAGIPATMRDVADQVLVCTGHGKKDRFPDLPEYCDHRTTIFLMAIGRIEGLTKALQTERGYPSDMPAAVIHAATTSDACTVRSTLSEIADEVRRRGIDPPGTLVLGNVVNALTYLEKYDAVKDVDIEPESAPRYTISYAPLSCLPEIDLGEHIVLNVKTKRPEIFGFELSIANVLFILLALASVVYSVASGVTITQA